ncbi:MAG TPA: imidazoleglycerol-phosphate dehydratase HisB [Spirochaetota bacterium]|nr:MAG: Imidazoleglycerol-phosphate dehydratase [Spirochaetes bacterium ADurb.BinA120]HPI15063.1 imidazoleglycerol-phosphate dehydratase HisB [Spirochaetota bacterium]
MRKAEIKRKTSETDISIRLVLDSIEKSSISTGVPFFDHMLDAMARHGHFFLDMACGGDYELDDHHTIEDTGICLGRAFKKALGDKAGIARFGHSAVPMDDALAMSVVDLSGRSYFLYTGPELSGYINRYSEELTLEFLRSFASNAEMNLHVMLFYGKNRHHIHEAIFKSLAVALGNACAILPGLGGIVPSTKGTIS